MRKLLKIGFLAVMIIILAGCSATRKRRSTETVSAPADATVSEIIAGVVNYNITDRGFIVKKGRIELEGTEIDGSFGFNARFNSKGDFLASVRGPLGIELARLISVGNDIAAIDRINRIVYIGKKDAVMSRNGVPEDFLKIIFGDMPDLKQQSYKTSGGNELVVNSVAEGFERELRICMDESKVCAESIRSTGSEQEITINFSNFRRSEGIKYASEILMREKRKDISVRLSIDDFSDGYDTDIEFTLPSYRRSSL